jgi:hypothetical protein
MFILNENEVQYCCINYEIAGRIKNISAVKYYSHMFIKVAAYATEQYQNAVSQCRYYLELEEPILAIVVKEETGYTLWCSERDLNLTAHENIPVNSETSTAIEKQELVKNKRYLSILSMASILLCL